MPAPQQPIWRAAPGYPELLVSDQGGVKRRDGKPVSVKKLGRQLVVGEGRQRIAVEVLVDLAFPPELIVDEDGAWMAWDGFEVSSTGRVRTSDGTELEVDLLDGRRVLEWEGRSRPKEIDHVVERVARAVAARDAAGGR